MSPALLLTLILSALLATLPVRQLHRAGWTSGALLTAWIVYAGLIVMGLDVGAGSKYLLPVLAVLYALPYVAGQARLEKVGRLFGARRAPERPVINVTPPSGPAMVEPKAEPAPKRHKRKPPIEYR